MERQVDITDADPPAGSQSVDRALALLGMVGRCTDDGASLAELVARSGLNKSTLRRLLLALMRNGMVEQNTESRRYYLGSEAYVLGTFAARRHGLLEPSLETLKRLAQETGDAAFLSVPRGPSALCLHREDGTYPIRSYALLAGGMHPLGVGAGSLAMLAALPDTQVEAMLELNATRLTEDYPLLPLQELRSRVTQTRAQGYALNPGLVVADSWGLGVALRGPDGELVGALSLAAIESRMQPPRRDALVAQLQTGARTIETILARLHAAPPRT
ncbi:IclR family transcriptional regulator [Sagittula sp. NFXS13]|uniref:IclR family transcriptional regulator n=1 Tax=Sagittula sp. NFXS13 TaxID=2819095 RepID=UPI0032DF914B